MIRQLSQDDGAAFKDLQVEAARETPASFSPSAQEVARLSVDDLLPLLCGSERCAAFGAFDGGQLVAVMGISCEPMAKLRHKAKLWGVYTKPAHRRAGLARQLMAHVLAWGRGKPDLHLITLSMNADNVAARALYTAFSFVSYGVQRKAMCLDGVYIDEDFMALDLDRSPTA